MPNDHADSPRARGWSAIRVVVMLAALALGFPLGDAAGNGPARGGTARLSTEFPLVLTQVPAGQEGPAKPPEATGVIRRSYGDGARILLVVSSSAARLLTDGFHSAADPCVSFDGKRMLFAAKRTAAERWAIYELTFSGGAIRPVVRMAGDCRSPSYQGLMYTIAEDAPWHQITFVATEPEWFNESGNGLASAIYSCRPDGSFVQRLTYNLSSDFDPAIMPDGRLVFAAWQRATFDRGQMGRVALMGVNTDGIDLAPFSGNAFSENAGKRVQHMPCATAAGLVVFVEADEVPWDGAGTLSCVSLRRPLHTYRQITAAADGLFHSPSGLPDGRVLVSRRPADGSAPHAVYCLEPITKQLAPVFTDPRFHCVQAQTVAPRPEPDGRSSVLTPEDPLGKLYCLDVYQTEFKDPSWFPRGTAQKVRVLQGIPRKTGGNNPSLQPSVNVPQLAVRRVLSEAPIAADGSFNVEVPANVPIQLQLLDERGLSLRSCGWIWTRNHEAQGCIGCHEDPELTPTNLQVDALKEETVSLAAGRPKRETVDFRRDVMPILAKKCAGCHEAQGSAPRLDSALAPKTVYETLLAREADGDKRAPRWKYVEPGKARTSPLLWHVFGVNTSRPWDGAVDARLAKAIPPDKSPPLSAEEKAILIRWIDMGATWQSAVPTIGLGGSN